MKQSVLCAARNICMYIMCFCIAASLHAGGFSSHTKVQTPQGPRPLGTLLEGEWVLS